MNRDLTNSVSDDSVVMAAAAAAAAVWSEEGRRRGKLRMKTFNEEWETALKWIASWDTTATTTTSTTNANSHDLWKDGSQHHSSHSSGKKKNKRKNKDAGRGNEKHDTEYESNGRASLSGDDLKLLDACIEKCMGKEWDPSFWDRYMKRFDTSTSSSSSRKPGEEDRGIHKSATKSKIRRLQRLWSQMSTMMMSRIRAFPFPFQSSHDVVGGIMAMMISSTCVLFLRNLVLDIRLKKYKMSLRSLLLEEEKMVEDKNHGSGRCRYSGGKKGHGKSKAKRKKKDGRQSRDDRSSRHLTSSSKGDGASTAWKDDNDDDHSTISEDSVEYIYFHNTKAQDAEKRNRKQNYGYHHQRHLEDNATTTSKENTSSTSSFVTEDSDYQEEMKYSKYHSFKAQPQSQRASTRKSDGKSGNVSSPSSRKDRKGKRTGERFGGTGPKVTSPMYGSPTHHTQTSQSILISSIKVQVPTPEQREEASRKLREYQKAQIDKIRQSQLKLQSAAGTAKVTKDALSTTTASSIRSSTNAWNTNRLKPSVKSPLASVPSSSSTPSRASPTRNGSPPGFHHKVGTVEPHKPTQTVQQPSSPEMHPSNQVGSLLLGLLDDDEDKEGADNTTLDIDAPGATERNPFRLDGSNSLGFNTSIRNDEDMAPSHAQGKMNRPIALGDLLAGHLTSNNATVSTPCSSNPWQNDIHTTTESAPTKQMYNFQSKNDTDATTPLSFFKSGDENAFEPESISDLSASARVFSPSWEEGGINKGDV